MCMCAEDRACMWLYQKSSCLMQLLFSSEGGARTLDLRIMNPTL